MKYKKLGKITNAQFGALNDRPFLFGLHLYFESGDGLSVGDGGQYMVNMSKECKWENDKERKEEIEKIMDFVYNLLEVAKIDSVSELVGIPVEITYEGNCFCDFRILHEVL